MKKQMKKKLFCFYFNLLFLAKRAACDCSTVTIWSVLYCPFLAVHDPARRTRVGAEPFQEAPFSKTASFFIFRD